MRYYDLAETPQTGKTFLEDGTNRIPDSDSGVEVYFQSIDKVKYDRSFDDEGYPILLEYALQEDGIRYSNYQNEPDEDGVYQPDDVAIQEVVDAEESEVFKAKQSALKLEGVLFDGVMCSATAEDMWGLNAVATGLTNFDTPYKFKFDNGNTLIISRENYMDFMVVWTPFRASFF